MSLQEIVYLCTYYTCYCFFSVYKHLCVNPIGAISRRLPNARKYACSVLILSGQYWGSATPGKKRVLTVGVLTGATALAVLMMRRIQRARSLGSSVVTDSELRFNCRLENDSVVFEDSLEAHTKDTEYDYDSCSSIDQEPVIDTNCNDEAGIVGNVEDSGVTISELGHDISFLEDSETAQIGSFLEEISFLEVSTEAKSAMTTAAAANNPNSNSSDHARKEINGLGTEAFQEAHDEENSNSFDDMNDIQTRCFVSDAELDIVTVEAQQNAVTDISSLSCKDETNVAMSDVCLVPSEMPKYTIYRDEAELDAVTAEAKQNVTDIVSSDKMNAAVSDVCTTPLEMLNKIYFDEAELDTLTAEAQPNVTDIVSPDKMNVGTFDICTTPPEMPNQIYFDAAALDTLTSEAQQNVTDKRSIVSPDKMNVATSDVCTMPPEMPNKIYFVDILTEKAQQNVTVDCSVLSLDTADVATFDVCSVPPEMPNNAICCDEAQEPNLSFYSSDNRKHIATEEATLSNDFQLLQAQAISSDIVPKSLHNTINDIQSRSSKMGRKTARGKSLQNLITQLQATGMNMFASDGNRNQLEHKPGGPVRKETTENHEEKVANDTKVAEILRQRLKTRQSEEKVDNDIYVPIELLAMMDPNQNKAFALDMERLPEIEPSQDYQEEVIVRELTTAMMQLSSENI